VITPTVGGTIIMLIAVTVFPIAFRMINEAPAAAHEGGTAGPVIAIATFAVILGISLFAKGAVRLWGPIVGVVAGSAIAIAFGAFDLAAVAEAPWIGLPDARWPGLDLSFGADFWWLLVPFTIVTIVGAIETYGDGVAIQRLSKRTQDPIDFRTVQGAVNADGLGNLLSGLAGTLPNTTYSTSLSVVDLTGVAARQVGLWGGLFLVLIGFCPKVSTLLMSIPSPIAGAYIMVLLILLFLHGLRLVTEDGLSYENGMIMCVAFWLAIGFQDQQIFAEHLPAWTRGLLDNGMTAGGIVAVVLSLLVGLRKGRGQRLEIPARTASIAELHRFLAELAGKAGWDQSAGMRLELAGEEAMLYLLDRPGQEERSRDRKVRVAAKAGPQRIELELACGTGGTNLDNAARHIDWDAPPSADDAGLRILRGLAERVRHEQFHGVDVLLVSLDSRPL
jgi:NCS2 family nucleobase:cation symporter-2/xanthine permease XanP